MRDILLFVLESGAVSTTTEGGTEEVEDLLTDVMA